MPDRLDRGLGDVDLDTGVHVGERWKGRRLLDDLSVDGQVAGERSGVELAHLDVRARARDGRSGVEASVDLLLKLGLDDVAPGVEGDDGLLVEPAGLGREVEGGVGVGVVGLVVGVERVEGDGKGFVDRVRARVGTGSEGKEQLSAGDHD